MERFRILRKIGEGGFGEVFEAVDSCSGHKVALKTIPVRGIETGEMPINVYRELMALRCLDLPTVVSLFDYFPDGSNLVLAMELARTDIGRLIARTAAIPTVVPVAVIKLIAMMLFESLDALHHSVVHRVSVASSPFCRHVTKKLYYARAGYKTIQPAVRLDRQA
jgi:serine/threonine protein kinase